MENKHIKNRESGLVIMPNENPDTGFSKHEMFGNLSLSLDIIGRRLMISGIVNRIRRSFQIQLNATRRISIKKVYMNIYIGQLKKRSLEEFLEAIYLQFEFFDGRQTIHLPVFDRALDNINDLPETEKKALYWQDLLSELLSIKNS
ncbi:MAG TPA: hypothetical protein VGQ53_10715 [Chitinophagaceae bacterium]|nr:hypothetical protein [Chitinophagaceae bacterium]